MAFRTIKEFEDLLQPVIVSILGWQAQSNDVRIGWIQTGQPAFKITDNVIFITASPVDSEISRHHDSVMEEGSPDIETTTTFTRVMALDVVAYGDEALDNLTKIRYGMYRINARNTLADADIYFIPNAPEPRRVPELFAGQWWERGDMKLTFNELMTEIENENAVYSAEIEIQNKDEILAEMIVD